MAKNLSWWTKRGRVVSQSKEVSENPCKSSSRTAPSHITVKGPRELETCDYPLRCRGNRSNHLKILNSCIFIPLLKSQVIWLPFPQLSPREKGRANCTLGRRVLGCREREQAGGEREESILSSPNWVWKEGDESRKKQDLPSSGSQREPLER